MRQARPALSGIQIGKRMIFKINPDTAKAWSEDEDMRLCDMIADGVTFAEAGKRLGRSKGQAIGRFGRIAKRYGEQGR